MPVDPVCGVELTSNEVAATVEHGDETYSFCSQGCAEHFAADPDHYLERPHPHLVTAGGLVTQRLPFERADGEFDLTVSEPGELSVGDRSTFTKSLDASDVHAFAEASGDTNALHLSDEFAAGTRFGRRIVHGTLVAGTISAALAALPGLTIYLEQHLEFQRPVDVGATVTASCEIVEALDRDRYRVATRVENEASEVVIDGSATVLIDPLPEMDAGE